MPHSRSKFHNPDSQCLPEMLARAWAVSEEIDKHFINLIYKLALSRLGLLRVSEYSGIRGIEYKIEYEYSSLPKSLDLFFFCLFCY